MMLSQRAAVEDAATDAHLVEEATLASRHEGVSESTAPPMTGAAPAISIPSRRQRRAARDLQARKVGRIVRHVDPFTVFRVAGLFYFCLFLTLMVATTFLWSVASNAGVIGGVEDFIRQVLALESFVFEGNRLFKLFTLGGVALVLVATVLTALGAVMFNFISDLVGGIRFTVVEEESARPVSGRPPTSGV